MDWVQKKLRGWALSYNVLCGMVFRLIFSLGIWNQ